MSCQYSTKDKLLKVRTVKQGKSKSSPAVTEYIKQASTSCNGAQTNHLIANHLRFEINATVNYNSTKNVPCLFHVAQTCEISCTRLSRHVKEGLILATASALRETTLDAQTHGDR